MTLPAKLAQLAKFDGYPPYLSPDYIATWNAYEHRAASTDREKLLGVVNFVASMTKVGLKATTLFSDSGKAFNPSAVYTALIQEEFTGCVKHLASQLRKYRLFDVFTVSKSEIQVDTREPDYITYVFSATPKKREHLDGALAKVQGLLYMGDVPIQLREKWKPIGVKSSRSPKSALPSAQALFKPSHFDVICLPLFITATDSLRVRRASGDVLVFKYRIRNPGDYITWCNRAAWEKQLKAVFKGCIQKL